MLMKGATIQSPQNRMKLEENANEVIQVSASEIHLLSF